MRSDNHPGRVGARSAGKPIADLIVEARSLGAGTPPGLCPCCGQSVDRNDFYVSLETNKASRWGEMIRLAPQQAEILSIIWGRYPGAARRGEIIAGMYGAQDWPDDPENVLCVRLNQLRRLLAPIGITIENHPYSCQLRLHDVPLVTGRKPNEWHREQTERARERPRANAHPA